MSISAINASTGYYPVTQTGNSGLAQLAASLSGEAGVIVTLGASPTRIQTYNAAGLLDSFVQAGTATPITPNGSGNQAQTVVNQEVVGALPTQGSGVYAGQGVSSQWASLLQSDPGLSGLFAAESASQGIVGTL